MVAPELNLCLLRTENPNWDSGLLAQLAVRRASAAAVKRGVLCQNTRVYAQGDDVFTSPAFQVASLYRWPPSSSSVRNVFYYSRYVTNFQ